MLSSRVLTNCFPLFIALIIWANLVNSLDLLMVVTLQHSIHKCKVLINSCSPLHELSISIWVCTLKIGTNPSNRHPMVVAEKNTCSDESMGLFKNHSCYQGCDLRSSECTGMFLESTYNRSTPHGGRCCTFWGVFGLGHDEISIKKILNGGSDTNP